MQTGKEKRWRSMLMTACMVFVCALMLQVADVKAAELDSGTTDNCSWIMYDTGVLQIHTTKENVWLNTVYESGYPWHRYRSQIKEIQLTADGGSYYVIGDNCFAHCINLTKVVFPGGKKDPTYIYAGAFKGCSSLKNITIPDTVERLASGAFESCGLTGFTWPAGVNFVYPDTFKNCKSLKSVDFSKFHSTASDASIAAGAFYGCSALESVAIPEGIIYISDEAFYGCTKLKTVTFPSTLAEVSGYAFQNCSSLEEVDLRASTKSNLKIRQYAFKDCTSLKRVKLGTNVSMLDGFAFQNCKALEEINLPSSVNTVACFEGCDSLKELEIPSSVTQLSFDSDPNKIYHSITNCKNLEKVVIPTSVTKILKGFLDGCPKAVIYTTAPSTAYQYAKENGIKVVPLNGGSGDCGTNLHWYFDSAKGALVIGGSGAMKNFDRNEDPAPWTVKYGNLIKSITVEAGVTTIGKDAFANLSAVTEVAALPASVEQIGETAFMNCTGVSEVTIPASVETIGKDAFKGDSGLAITTTDGSAAADYAAANGIKCPAKTAAQVKAEAEQKKEEEKKTGEGGSAADPGAQGGNQTGSGSQTDAVTFTAKNLTFEVTSSGEKNEVTVTGISDKKKTSITIPATVKYEGVKYTVTAIGEKAFANCKKLKKIKIKSKKLSSVGKDAFKKIHKKAVIEVPSGKLAAYKKLLKKKGQAKTVKIK